MNTMINVQLTNEQLQLLVTVMNQHTFQGQISGFVYNLIETLSRPLQDSQQPRQSNVEIVD